MRSPDERGWSIRAAVNPDCPGLPDIERSAAELFGEFGMHDVADGEVTNGGAWEPHCANETVWVAVDEHDTPIAFLASGVQAPVLFIYELAVQRDWQRRGIGRALLAQARRLCDVAWIGGGGPDDLLRRALERTVLRNARLSHAR